jgi:hypothetical protein
MKKHYLRIEGVNLDNFVYDTQDLSTIRGSGLAVLNAVNRLDGEEITGLTLHKISSGASAGLFEFEGDVIDEMGFCEEVRTVLTNKIEAVRYATFAIDILPAVDEDFKLVREKTLAKNRWSQMQSPRISIPAFGTDTSDGFKRVSCEVNSLRRVNQKRTFKSGKKEVSDSVATRREYGSKEKQNFVKNELKDFFEVSRIKHKFAWDFDSLTFAKRDGVNTLDKGNLHHKMAVIYLDGNNFGKKQKDLEIPELQQFDQNKTDFQRQWLAALVNKVVDGKDWQICQKKDSGETETLYRLEILLWGGDEICIVVPAWKGWEVVEQFYHQATWSDDITHSLGMVFCHHNAPIRRIINLTEELAGLAKRKSRGSNLFCYEILKSFDHIGGDLDDHRNKRSAYGENAEGLILDAAMFSKGITGAVRELKQAMPRRKLNQIVMKLLSLPTTADNKRERERESEIVKILEAMDKDTVAKMENYKGLFGGRNELFLHIQALWDFIEDAK